MRDLPVQDGWPVPWFVAQLPDGKYEFRAADSLKYERALREQRCWVCGGRLGVFLVFVIGPMCAITGVTGEPACHLECARWSAKNCPFLSRPWMRRREDNMPEGYVDGPGDLIKRNPGVTMLWVTYNFSLEPDNKGKDLILLGDPEAVEFYVEGRIATRAEIVESVNSGLPYVLPDVEKGGPKSLQAFQQRVQMLEGLYPKEEEVAAV